MDETLRKLYKVLVHFEEKEVEITEDEAKLKKIKEEIEENLNISIEDEQRGGFDSFVEGASVCGGVN
ncbi:hypothetical protein K9E66_09800 [Staphylococcus pseudintermedius]|nr:hypothetical protein K9E75_07540 [Staphylococcus pseudintermedius]USO15638.1 hypothetical protein K9E66_09800 [Staphylococcus pseudintermedius]